MIIDGIRTAFTDEKNILQVIRKAGIHVPTFCYYTDMSIYGALCALWKMNVEALSPPVPHRRKTKW